MWHLARHLEFSQPSHAHAHAAKIKGLGDPVVFAGLEPTATLPAEPDPVEPGFLRRGFQVA